jgi:hypothetical protein
MARPPRFTADQIIRALIRTRGMVTLAAERLACDADTIYNYAKRHPTVEAELKRQRERITDIAESKLYLAIDVGESWAIQYYLRTQGKNRGYVERQEITGKDGDPLAPLITVYMPTKDQLNGQPTNGHSPPEKTRAVP